MASNYTVHIAKVIDNYDPNGGGRVRAKLLPDDKQRRDDVPFSFPLLPKLIHIIPKIGELVLVICERRDTAESQRYYIGPIVSQETLLNYDNSLDALSLLKGGVAPPKENPNNIVKTKGALAEKRDIAIYGRKDCDIILSDDDVRIRCGVRLSERSGAKFNDETGSFIKLKYFPIPLELHDGTKISSAVNIVGDKINLISRLGDRKFDINDTKESISDESFKDIEAEIHKLPYGDNLVKFLYLFLKLFENHTHKYDNDKPCIDKTTSDNFYNEFSSSESDLKDKLLSKNIGIN